MQNLFFVKRRMTVTVVIASIFFAATSFAQQSEPYHVLLLQDSDIRNVYVETSGGSISVIHDHVASPRVEMYVRSSGNRKLSESQIDRLVYEHYQLQLKTEENLLELIALRTGQIYSRESQLNISFKVFVPDPSVNVRLKTSGGALDLKNLRGQIEASTSGGNISIGYCEGNIQLITSGGNISAQQSSGELTLKTSGGALSLKNLGGVVNAVTSSGAVNAEDVRGSLSVVASHGAIKLSKIQGVLDASTSHGDIEAHMTSVDSPAKLKTANGRIVLRVPGKTGMDLELEGPRVNVPNLGDFTGRAGNTQIKGRLYGGGASLQAKSLRGKVKLIFENGV